MNKLLLHVLFSVAFFALLGTQNGFGQTPPTNSVALRVSDLTSEERDQLSNDLNANGALRISFACVPAGIIILEPVDPGRSANSVRALAAAALIHRLPAERRSEVSMTTHDAEDLCAAARNH